MMNRQPKKKIEKSSLDTPEKLSMLFVLFALVSVVLIFSISEALAQGCVVDIPSYINNKTRLTIRVRALSREITSVKLSMQPAGKITFDNGFPEKIISLDQINEQGQRYGETVIFPIQPGEVTVSIMPRSESPGKRRKIDVVDTKTTTVLDVDALIVTDYSDPRNPRSQTNRSDTIPTTFYFCGETAPIGINMGLVPFSLFSDQFQWEILHNGTRIGGGSGTNDPHRFKPFTLTNHAYGSPDINVYDTYRINVGSIDSFGQARLTQSMKIQFPQIAFWPEVIQVCVGEVVEVNEWQNPRPALVDFSIGDTHIATMEQLPKEDVEMENLADGMAAMDIDDGHDDEVDDDIDEIFLITGRNVGTTWLTASIGNQMCVQAIVEVVQLTSASATYLENNAVSLSATVRSASGTFIDNESKPTWEIRSRGEDELWSEWEMLSAESFGNPAWTVLYDAKEYQFRAVCGNSIVTTDVLRIEEEIIFRPPTRMGTNALFTFTGMRLSREALNPNLYM